MIAGFFMAFLILATVSAAPVDSFLNASPLSDLKSFTGYNYVSPDDLNNPPPTIPFGYSNVQSNPQPPSEQVQTLNVAEYNEPSEPSEPSEYNFNTAAPMTVPVGYNLDPNAFNLAQANSGATFECNKKHTRCRYCESLLGTSCKVYHVNCNGSFVAFDDCTLCTTSPDGGVTKAVCSGFVRDFKNLPPPHPSFFNICTTRQCNNT